ncbi:uncharacterized protein LOC134303681 [Trichomycterus rosablanca]|uniref:uncharacterized protein LOC134303681 n=1 Tax=Trichomycterus rosablanca TaxID=2290929 RepID=UPI002F35E345
MLPALCSLLAALSCVSGVTVVTQKPPVLTVKKGEKITMYCNLGTVTDSSARWYKQVPGEAPHSSPPPLLLHLLLELLVSSLSTRVLSAAFEMLPALCSLLAALSCVSGVIVVTQNPPVLQVKGGEKITMHCNLGTVTNDARWYKQVSGEAPQFMLNNYHAWGSPRYRSGFSAPKFTSTYSSKSDYTLIINNVEVSDSAVYYCTTRDSSANEHVSQ